MRELDLLLEGYLEKHFENASAGEQVAFTTLLSLPDPVLMSYIMGRASPDTEEQRLVIESLRRAS